MNSPTQAFAFVKALVICFVRWDSSKGYAHFSSVGFLSPVFLFEETAHFKPMGQVGVARLRVSPQARLQGYVYEGPEPVTGLAFKSMRPAKAYQAGRDFFFSF